jgi:predicted  nucleic acid-binding Zn-ribbon protein
VKELEESVLKVMTESEGFQSQLDARKDAHDDLQSRYDAAHGEWQSSLGDLKKEADALRKKAEALEVTLSPRMKNEFQKIYRQRQGVAVSRVVNGTCSSCRTHVRAMVAQQLKRGELVHCEGCHRILYWEKVPS